MFGRFFCYSNFSGFWFLVVVLVLVVMQFAKCVGFSFLVQVSWKTFVLEI